jgi:hypothetical protein
MYRVELEQQQVNNNEKMMSTQFLAWFEKHIRASFTTTLNHYYKFTNSPIQYCFLQLPIQKNEGTTNVDEDMYSLACRPDRRVRSYSSCIINGVQYHTMAREAQRKTQNCTIKTLGTNNDYIIEFYGTVIEIIELNYITNSKGPRSVILLRCEWYNLEGKT